MSGSSYLRMIVAADRELSTRVWPRDRACPAVPRSFAPLAQPLIVRETPDCIAQMPMGGDVVIPFGLGMSLAWTPAPDRRVVLVAFPGLPATPVAGFAASLTRTGLRNLIADLQSIEAQLDEQHG